MNAWLDRMREAVGGSRLAIRGWLAVGQGVPSPAIAGEGQGGGKLVHGWRSTVRSAHFLFMPRRSAARRWRTSIASAVLVLIAASAAAQAPRVERFDTATWTSLQKELSRPAAVVFTATYCANCPAVLAKLSAALEKRGLKGDVVAVVIDEANARELMQSGHYAHATRLFSFEGNEASLRYQVDPRWRGVTPYTALLAADGAMTFATGIPSEEEMATWLEN